MARLRWTNQAAADFEAVVDFIAEDSACHARRFAADILAAVERLEMFPLSGRIVPEMGEPFIREIIVGKYRIVYRVEDDLVTLLTVCHGARLFDTGKLE